MSGSRLSSTDSFSSHPFDPWFDSSSRVLILGSFPSRLSRKNGFYYGNHQNRFWPLLARCFREGIPASPEDKKIFILKHHLALYDVYAGCEINGSQDDSIKKAKLSDLSPILRGSSIRLALANGAKASQGLKLQKLSIPTIVLPSTSPANAAFSLSRLQAAWEPYLLSAEE